MVEIDLETILIEAQNTDQKILSLILEGTTSEQGYRLLVNEYQEKIYWVIRKMVSSHDECDDILQEVFIKIFKGINRFKRESKLYTWIYRIAVNETLAYLRKKKSNVISIDSVAYTLHDGHGENDYADGDAILKTLNKAVSQLPEKQKLVFNLRYFQEMKYQDISEILNTSEGALKANFHHAVKKIEQYIKDYDTQAS